MPDAATFPCSSISARSIACTEWAVCSASTVAILPASRWASSVASSCSPTIVSTVASTASAMSAAAVAISPRKASWRLRFSIRCKPPGGEFIDQELRNLEMSVNLPFGKHIVSERRPAEAGADDGDAEASVTHRGVAVDDPRNAAVLAFLTPLDYSDEAVVRERLSRTLRRASPAKIDETVAKIMLVRSPPVAVSQPLEAVADPRHGLGTHPDLVERLWKLDAALPERCRWVVHGHPALVHPASGVVFGFAGGML